MWATRTSSAMIDRCNCLAGSCSDPGNQPWAVTVPSDSTLWTLEMRTDFVFYAGIAGAWLGLGLGGWRLLQHDRAGATAGLLLSIASVALLMLWDRRFTEDIHWSLLSGGALLAVTCVLLTG